MLERVAYGTLSIAILLGLFLLDAVIASHAEDLTGPVGELLRRGSVIPIAILVVILLGAVELSHLLRVKGARPFTLFGYIVIAVLVLTPWLSAAGWLGSGAVQVEGIYWQAVWLMTACGGVGLAVIIRRDPAGFLRDAGTTLLVIVYLGFLGSFGLQLRCGRDMPEQTGVWLLLMVILITKASDIGAYFAGSLFGRHKLVPTISPAKTIEGAIGGLLASAAVAVLIMSTDPSVIPPTSRLGSLLEPLGLRMTFQLLTDSETALSTFRAAVFGFIVSLSGQLGDIVESSFKRDACVKDSGKLIPRFGGILDLIDSPMLAVPVAWFLMTAVWRIV
jgi:phosphatidate cytidylyltransferase